MQGVQDVVDKDCFGELLHGLQRENGWTRINEMPCMGKTGPAPGLYEHHLQAVFGFFGDGLPKPVCEIFSLFDIVEVVQG